tara:strand:+ start:1154 stop:1321 length:168 start_codon:yes stop_codon:yes gene_type:complete
MKSQREDIRDSILAQFWYRANDEMEDVVWRKIQDNDAFFPFRLVDMVSCIRSSYR